ncbi:unnamed protein product, partial [Rotaria socialis]
MFESMGAGPNIQLCSKSYDDLVLVSPRFDSLRYSKREQWFGYMNANRNLEDRSQLTSSPVPVPQVEDDHSNTAGPMLPPTSITPSSSARSRTAISPALMNHIFHPSPKKAVAKIWTVAQELHATSVLTTIIVLLNKFRKCISLSDNDVGKTSTLSHSIKLTCDIAIKQPIRRINGELAEEVETQLQQLSDDDIIRPSNSPWSSCIVPVKKRCGGLRLAIDYRALNN